MTRQDPVFELSPAGRDRLRGVRSLLQAGELTRAAGEARAALDSGLRHPFLFNALAVELESRQQLAEAEASLREGLALAPGDVGTLHALGLLLLRRERPEEARPLFEQVLARMPDFAPAQVALGQALEGAGLLPAAEAAYRRGLKLEPGNLLAHAGIASVCVRRGERAQAREHG